MMELQHRNFADVFFNRASRRPHDVAYRFHVSGSTEVVSLGMRELDQRVRATASDLQMRGLVGERVVIALPNGADFIIAFYACLVAGVIAVPVPQQRVGKKDARFDAVISNAAPALVLVDAAVATSVQESIAIKAISENRLIAVVATLDEIHGDPEDFIPAELDSDSLAVLQYTSGSTGEPKGVMISHGNFLSNCQLIKDTLHIDAESAGISWLPFYHDMGLVGALLMPMYCEACADLMLPQEFLRSPMLWLKRLSDLSATTTAAPNFALERCCDMANPEALAGLDLSSLRCLLTGSEPVNPNTLERFAATFAPCGFRPDAFLPAYGLAEATLLATGTLRHGTGPTLKAFDRSALAARALRPAQEQEGAARLIGNGSPNGLVIIADPDTQSTLGDGKIGEIWLTGPGMAKGYWGRPELTQSAFGARLVDQPHDGPFYRTGDLGFIQDDDLFITGRIKDLIIIRGRNIFPQDIEEVATRDQSLLMTGGAAAFAITRDRGEEVVLVAEASLESVRALRSEDAATALVSDLLKRLADSHEIMPAEICIIRPGRLPRTSSGKVRRGSAREEWEANGFETALIHRWTRPGAAADTAPLQPKNDGHLLSRHEVEAWLLERLSHHSGQPKHMINLDEPFASYGLDSLAAVEMIDAVNTLNTGAKAVDAVDLFDYPTIARLLDHMFSVQTKDEARSAVEAEAAALAALLDG